MKISIDNIQPFANSSLSKPLVYLISAFCLKSPSWAFGFEEAIFGG